MKNLILACVLTCASWSVAPAQLPNGTVAPDFTATDLNGVSHNLYTLLNQGKTVYVEFSATWCGICWNYHNTHALRDLWNTYGPPGTNEAYVLFIESYQPSNTNCLYGSSGCNNSTLGNWVTGTPYPIADDSSIGDLYFVSAYPTIFCICPADKKLYATGTQNMAGLWNVRSTNCISSVQVTTNSVQHVSCFGSNSGGIDITPAGGVSPYTYTWSNGTTTQDLVNIPAGTYTCTVTANNGASVTSPPIIVANPQSTLTLAQTASTLVGCNGIAGSITVSGSGGWGSYNYTWSNGQTGPLASGLNPGNYTVTITDLKGCTKTLSATIAPLVLPTATIATPTSITCVQTTVQLNGTGSSNGANYAYLWTASNGGNIVGSNTILTPTVNTSGMYTLRVTNTTTACSSTAAASVPTNTTAPTAVATASGNLNCHVPQLQVNGTGSSQGNNFTYAWTTTNGNIVSGQTTLSPLVNQAGTYKIVVTNTTTGCTASATTLLLQSPPVTAIISASANIACNGGSNGAATASSSGGNGAFTYTWSTGNTGSAVSGLPAGMYLVTVSDAETCTASATVMLTQPLPLAVNATATAQTAVDINNGTAAASPTGGTPEFTYVWNTGANTATINSLAPGSYAVTITDTHGCSASQTVVVNVYSCAIGAQSTVINAACANAANGTASTMMTGGTIPFSYLWSNSATSASITGLPAGTYLVTVTDAAGCTTLATATVAQPTPISLNAMATAQTAVGINNGTATAMSSGGTPGYSYSWSTGANTTTINGLAPGNYTVTVTDTNGCSASKTVVVNVYNCTIAALPGLVNTTCANTANGSVSITMTGGTAPFNYSWSNGATTASIANLPAGNYLVTVTDAAGCTTLANAAITQPSPIAVNATATAQTAVGLNNGTATVTPVGGTPGFTYFWSNGSTNSTINSLVPGNYSVTVTDMNGCTAAQTVVVGLFNCLVTAQSNIFNASCMDMPNGAVTITMNGGTAPFTYTWNNGATTQTIANQLPGNYFVTVTDLSGCQTITPVTIGIADQIAPVLACPANIRVCPNSNIVQYPAPVASDNCGLTGSQLLQTGGLPPGSSFPLGTTVQTFRLTDGGGNTAVCTFEVIVSSPVVFENVQVTNAVNNQNNGGINIMVSGGTAPYFFLWTNSTGQFIGASEDISNLAPGFYAVKVTDLYGCEFFYAVEVKSTTGTHEPAWLSGISIQPNPAGDRTRVVLGSIPTTTVRITVVDAGGKIWLTQTSTDAQVDLDCSGFPAGMYWVGFRSEYGLGYRKLIVVK